MPHLLITGASSYVGAKIYRDLKQSPHFKSFEIVGTYNCNPLFPELVKLDLSDRIATSELIKRICPTWIIHIAAIPNQAGCSKDEGYAERVNYEGTRAVVEEANALGAKVLFISSEAAYDHSLYGKLKKQGEDAVKGTRAGYVILQPAMIFGASPNTKNDRPYNRLLRAIEKGAPTSFDSDVKFYPTWLGNLSEIIQEILRRPILNEVIAVVGERESSRFEVAQKVLQKFSIPVSEEHSKSSGSNAPLTQDALRRLKLPCYSTDEILTKVALETEGLMNPEKR